MERETLIRLLATADGEAFAACGAAIDRGAEFVVWDDPVPADHLARNYARREQHLRKIGTPTVGFAESVQRLQSSGDRSLRVGQARSDDPPYHFQLFLDAENDELIACLGIDQR